MSEVRFIDLFAGIGGFRIAAESVGMRCVFSSEINKQACKTYKANFGEYPSGDISKIKASRVPNHDLLCAGFPCQAFSAAGNQKGFKDPRGQMIFEILRIAKKKRPKVLLLENVPALRSNNEGKTFHWIKNKLKLLGYKVFHQVLDASDFGLATVRKRVFIVCFRRDLKVKKFSVTYPPFKDVRVKDILQPRQAKEFKIKNPNLNWSGAKGNSLRKLQYLGHIGNTAKQGQRIYSPKGLGITLTASGGGSAAHTGAYLINGVTRRLSPRESARLMGFPDSFKIVVSKCQAWRQFGNSVALPVVKAILKEIVKVLNEPKSLKIPACLKGKLKP